MTNHEENGREAQGLTRRAIGSALWLFSGSWVQAVLRLTVLTILARILGPEEFGLAAAALLVTGFFRIFLQTGVRPALIQRHELEERHVRTAFTVSLLIGTGFAALVIVAAPWVATIGFRMPDLTRVLQAIVLILPLQSFGVVAISLLEREMRFKAVVRIQLLSYTAGYAAVGTGLAVAGYGVWALVGAYVAQELLSTLMAVAAQPHSKRPLLERRALRELLYFGGGFAVARFGNFGALNGDKWVAGRWLGQELLGFYKYAAELTHMIASLFGTVLDKVLFPAMAKVQDDPVRLANAYRTGVGMVSMLVLPTSAAITVVAPELIRLILGPTWEPVVEPFRVLALALIIRATLTMSDSLARATGAVYRRAWRQAIYAAAVISLAWVGQRWGLEAMSVGVVGATGISFLLMTNLTLSLAALRPRDILVSHLGAVLSFGISFAAMGVTASACRDAAFPDLAVVLLASGATGAALLLGFALFPRWLLGPDGAAAVAMLIDFATARFGGAKRLPGLKTLGRRLARK